MKALDTFQLDFIRAQLAIARNELNFRFRQLVCPGNSILLKAFFTES